MVRMKNIKQVGDVISFEASGDEKFTCSFNYMTGETNATTKNGTLLSMAKLRLFSTLLDKGTLPNELVAMSY